MKQYRGRLKHAAVLKRQYFLDLIKRLKDKQYGPFLPSGNLKLCGGKESESVFMQFLAHDREMAILVILEQRRSSRKTNFDAFLFWSIILSKFLWGYGGKDIKALKMLMLFLVFLPLPTLLPSLSLAYCSYVQILCPISTLSSAQPFQRNTFHISTNISVSVSHDENVMT